MELKIDKVPNRERLMSVDALRGFDMFWIIGGSKIVLTFLEGTGIAFFSNAQIHFTHTWGEFRFYDLITPLFLFIVGIVMPFSFTKRLSRGETKKKLYFRIVKRVVILYILGLISSGQILTYDISKIHLWTNTLHAIAVGYFISSIIILELKLKWQIVITGGLLFLYWGVMALVPIPGHEAGIYERDLNLALYVDDAVLGHFQEGSGWTYILSNMTFVCSVMLGVFAGKILLSERSPIYKTCLLAFIGVCSIFNFIVYY